MCECRYYGKCAGNCDGRGLVLGFGNETYDCDYFQPMPDVEALMKLADEMTVEKGDIWRWSSRIRESLGVDDG